MSVALNTTITAEPQILFIQQLHTTISTMTFTAGAATWTSGNKTHWRNHSLT